MNEETVRGIMQKAENDIKTAKDELATKNPATDTVCFHCQQSVEKYLKAYLIFNGREIRKTHDIAEIISLCKDIDVDFQKLYDWSIDKLTKYAVEVRYSEIYFPSEKRIKRSY